MVLKNIEQDVKRVFCINGSVRRTPKILYISEPWVQNGAQVRYLGVLRALQQIGTVEVANLRARARNPEPLPSVESCVPSAHFIDTRLRPHTGLISKLRFTFDPRADYPYCNAVSDGEYGRIAGMLRSFDVIWFFKQRSPDIFPNMNWQRSVVDIDDLQSTYERVVLGTGSPLERLKALRGLFIWQRRESLLSGRFNVLTVCSDEDRNYLRRIGAGGPVHVIPNGFDKPGAEPIRKPTIPPRIGFIGNFEHLPNREGMRWFVKHCWPMIRREIPGIRLRLVGFDSEKVPELKVEATDRLGWLSDPSDEISTWHAMVVPIHKGAGTRVKIAEGFSKKCPIVSTHFGAFGYGAVHGRQMYLADSATDFSNACIRAICEPEEAASMAERAWSEFLEKWTWDAINPRVWAAAEACLRLNAAS